MQKFCFLVVCLVGILVSIPASAQTKDGGATSSLQLKVHFKVDKNNLDLSYDGNGDLIDDFLNKLSELKSDPSFTVIKVNVVGSASPEGYYDNNFRLSSNRAQSLISHIKPYVPLPSGKWSITSLGSNWDEMSEMALKDGISHSDEIARIVREVPIWVKENGKIVGGRKKSLMDLDGGRPWKVMVQRLFPELRKATLEMFYSVDPKPVLVPKVDTVTVERYQRDTTVIKDTLRTPKVALKTNLLYDVALAPTIGLEVPIGKAMSIAADWTYSWWSNDTKSLYHRLYGGNLELRWWLGHRTLENILTGHHIGIYGQAFTFDFMLNENYGVQSPNWTAGCGLEYGYSLSLGRNLNLDFLIGIGHVFGDYTTYHQITREDGVHYIKDEVKTFPAIMPTRAEVSLVWLLR